MGQTAIRTSDVSYCVGPVKRLSNLGQQSRQRGTLQSMRQRTFLVCDDPEAVEHWPAATERRFRAGGPRGKHRLCKVCLLHSPRWCLGGSLRHRNPPTQSQSNRLIPCRFHPSNMNRASEHEAPIIVMGLDARLLNSRRQDGALTLTSPRTPAHSHYRWCPWNLEISLFICCPSTTLYDPQQISYSLMVDVQQRQKTPRLHY